MRALCCAHRLPAAGVMLPLFALRVVILTGFGVRTAPSDYPEWNIEVIAPARSSVGAASHPPVLAQDQHGTKVLGRTYVPLSSGPTPTTHEANQSRDGDRASGFNRECYFVFKPISGLDGAAFWLELERPPVEEPFIGARSGATGTGHPLVAEVDVPGTHCVGSCEDLEFSSTADLHKQHAQPRLTSCSKTVDSASAKGRGADCALQTNRRPPAHHTDD